MRVDRSDVQGLVASGFGAHPASTLLLMRFGPKGARDWLRRLLPFVTSARRGERLEPVHLNVALSFMGLTRLGLPAETLAAFAPEFRAGMAARAPVLGDVGEDDPRHWEFGNAERPVDALLLVYARDEPILEGKRRELLGLAERFDVSCLELPTYLDPEHREHFGFRFAVSEPRIRGGLARGRGGVSLPPGELLLGYPNVSGERAPTPLAPFRRSTREAPLLGPRGCVDLGHNGTYLVLRKLEQRVAFFWSTAQKLARRSGAPADPGVVAARWVGRWPNGAPLARYPDGAPDSVPEDDRFTYRNLDPEGRKCPVGAHVRRVNPRDGLAESRAHQLVRRGRLYGPRALDPAVDDGVERGLAFVALNADLARQFETVQQSFVNGPSFGGLRGERDPLLGCDAEDETGIRRAFTEPGFPARRRTGPLPRFVRMRGGEYFFLPGLCALGYLAEG